MERVDTVRGRSGEGGHSQGEVLWRGWTQSQGDTAERVDSEWRLWTQSGWIQEVLWRGWTQSGGGTAREGGPSHREVLLRGWTVSGRYC